MVMVCEESLIEAVVQGQIQKALELLNQGADPDEQDPHYGWSSLHLCARDGKVGLARLLLKRGATVDIRDAVGQTPLHRAAFWGQAEMVNLLLDQRADFTALDDLLQTPEELARIQGHRQVCELIQQCMVFLELGGFEYPPRQLEVMRKQLRRKLEEDRRRREMKEELAKQGMKAERERERLKAQEQRLLEKQEELNERLLALKEEMAALLATPHERLSKKQVSALKHLQVKIRKLETKIDTQRLKINQKRSRSLQSLPTELKGAAWIAFINEV